MLALVLMTLVGCGESGGSTSTSPTAPGAPGAATAPAQQADGAVVATVGPGFVTDAEFAAAAARSATPGQDLPLEKRKEVLDKLVTEEVLFQEAAAKGLYRDPKVRKIMVNLLLREEIYADVRATDITPEELEAYYNAHRDEFVVPEKVQVKRIFIRYGEGARTEQEAQALATDIQKQLKADSSKFKELAEQYSDDPYKRRGGDLGYLSREGKPGIPPEVVEKAFSLSVGQVSPPFEAGDGFNVVQVAAKREAVERTFDQMKGSVLRRLKNDRFQELTDKYISDARARYDVKVDEAALMATKIEARPVPPGGGEHGEEEEEEGVEGAVEGDGE
jgi:parvulin-like peptidyl-prolyl isomerase